MANFFDQFDEAIPQPETPAAEGNFFDQFDERKRAVRTVLTK